MADLSEADKRILFGAEHVEGDLPGLVEDLDAAAYARDRLESLKDHRVTARWMLALGFILCGAAAFRSGQDFGWGLAFGLTVTLASLGWLLGIGRAGRHWALLAAGCGVQPRTGP